MEFALKRTDCAKKLWEYAAVATNPQRTRNLESFRSQAALPKRLLHSFRRRPDRVDWAERFGEIHAAADFGRHGGTRQRRSCGSQAPPSLLRGARPAIC